VDAYRVFISHVSSHIFLCHLLAVSLPLVLHILLPSFTIAFAFSAAFSFGESLEVGLISSNVVLDVVVAMVVLEVEAGGY
jgi:hypothetical protein